MEKQRILIEHNLNSSSANIIWGLIGTAEGLSRWMADEVEQHDDRLTFTWGEPWSHQEIKTATICENVRNHHLRFRWDEETEEETFIELRMERSDLTGDYTLLITDYADLGEADSLRDLWEDNLGRLRQLSGI